MKMLASAVLLLGCAGCSSSPSRGDSALAPFEDPEHVRTWANTASALAVWLTVHDAAAFSDGRMVLTDPECPATSDDGATATLVGDCTDRDDAEWHGTLIVERAEEGDRNATFESYGRDEETRTGSLQLRRVTESLHEFDIELVKVGGMTTTINYSGHVEGGYEGPTVWNGSGTVERAGFVPPVGAIEAETIDQVINNDVCSGQSVSGETRVEQAGRTAVVSYDGATDCDEDQAARWSLDGEDMGFVAGVACTIAAPVAKPWLPGVAAALLAAWLLGFRRR